jgi:putative protease
MTPAGNRSFKLASLEDQKGQARDDAPGSGHIVRIPAQELDVGASSILTDDNLQYALLMRNL